MLCFLSLNFWGSFLPGFRGVSAARNRRIAKSGDKTGARSWPGCVKKLKPLMLGAMLLGLMLFSASCTTSSTGTGDLRPSTAPTSLGNAYRVGLEPGIVLNFETDVDADAFMAVAVNEVRRVDARSVELVDRLWIISPPYLTEWSQREFADKARILELEDRLRGGAD